MRKQSLFLALITLFVCLGFAACNKDDDNNIEGKSTLNIRLTDGPADYDAVYIDVQEIEIHTDQGGWVKYTPAFPGIYNLLDFRNGMDTLLCHIQLPAGKISQMRLILGPNNTVVVNGETKPLSTPSAQQSGLKFNIHQELMPNLVYDIWIDFDAGKSIVETGNGSYILKPVIRSYTALTNGRVKGFVLPTEANAIVYAINGVDTFSAIPELNGYFMFCGLPAGNSNIWIDAAPNSNFQDIALPNVAVSFGTINDLGVITLLP